MARTTPRPRKTMGSPIRTISACLNAPTWYAMAFGGVLIGSVNGREHEKVTGIIVVKGLLFRLTAKLCAIGNSTRAVATSLTICDIPAATEHTMSTTTTSGQPSKELRVLLREADRPDSLKASEMALPPPIRKSRPIGNWSLTRLQCRIVVLPSAEPSPCAGAKKRAIPVVMTSVPSETISGSGSRSAQPGMNPGSRNIQPSMVMTNAA
mmetsp:Transcript_33073/g.98433  ORF Transcript_33073/g.98433 Transcript_33073/m.98433 type:complete len:209 (+) Transcript_33073:485-1111(+)